jgi:hypothetical protein
VAQAVEYPSSKLKAPSSNSTTAKERKEKKVFMWSYISRKFWVKPN